MNIIIYREIEQPFLHELAQLSFKQQNFKRLILKADVVAVVVPQKYKELLSGMRLLTARGLPAFIATLKFLPPLSTCYQHRHNMK